MMPGPDLIYECPNCPNLIKSRSLSSGNMLDPDEYSDGLTIFPFLPEFPNLIKCKKCDTIFWLSKMNEIGTIEYEEKTKPEWQNADWAEFLEIDDYFRALQTGKAENTEEELFIRLRIWWKYNDRVRNEEKIFFDGNDEIRYSDNIRKLLTMLDPSYLKHKMMTAEINRNLGKFENCMDILNSIDDAYFIPIKEKIARECKRKNRWVIKFE